MSTGTKIVQDALAKIGAHSVTFPAKPESLETGKDELNSMIAGWQDDNISFGAVPLNAIGDELSEPLGLRTTIINNLAVRCHPLFPGSQISSELVGLANRGYNEMVARYQTFTIPKPQARGTLPKGQGNERGYTRNDPFFKAGDEIG